MTDAARPKPTSNRIFAATLKWGSLVTGVLVIAGALIGLAVAGVDGMWSALCGVLLSAVFLAITAVSILIANRWFGDALYVPIFFGIVLGGWILKFVLFLVILFLLRGQPWLHEMIFFLSVVASVVGALVVDVIAMTRLRMPYASDVRLPGDDVPPRETGDQGVDS